MTMTPEPRADQNRGRAVDDEDPARSPMDGRVTATGSSQPYDVDRLERDRAQSMGVSKAQAKAEKDMKPDREVEKDYPLPKFIDELRRLADALEKGQRFEIHIAGERISVPVRASYNIEHEREGGEEEIEFQIKWSAE